MFSSRSSIRDNYHTTTKQHFKESRGADGTGPLPPSIYMTGSGFVTGTVKTLPIQREVWCVRLLCKQREVWYFRLLCKQREDWCARLLCKQREVWCVHLLCQNTTSSKRGMVCSLITLLCELREVWRVRLLCKMLKIETNSLIPHL